MNTPTPRKSPADAHWLMSDLQTTLLVPATTSQIPNDTRLRLYEIGVGMKQLISDLAAAQEARERAEGEVERLLVDSEAAHATMTALRDDRRRLQKALAFWMPCIAGEETPAGERVAKEAFLLFGMPQEDDEPNAQELGWIVMDSEAKLLREERNSAEAMAESLKADAERYRWLRAPGNECNVEIPSRAGDGYFLIGYAELLDAAIDAERGKE